MRTFEIIGGLALLAIEAIAIYMVGWSYPQMLGYPAPYPLDPAWILGIGA